MQQRSALLGRNFPREQFASGAADLCRPGTVFRAELPLQFLPKSLGQGRDLPACGDSDLQRPTADYGGIVEVTVFRFVDGVAQDALALRLAEDAPVQFPRRRGRNDEE